MIFKKIISMFVLVLAVLPFWGCKADPKSASKESKPVDASVSRKLVVVSPAFLSPEMEQKRLTSHQLTIDIAKDGTGVAYVEPFEGKYRVVHNGQPGKPYLDISELSISSDGKRVAYVGHINEKLNKMVVDGREGFAFGPDDNHWFTPDGRQHVSTVTEGDNKYMMIEKQVNRDYRIKQGPVVSPDSGALAFTVKSDDGSRNQFIISDMKLQNKTVFDSCGGYIFPNTDNSMLAVGCSSGGAEGIKVIDFPGRSVVSDSKVNGIITHMKFAADNRSLMYTVIRNNEHRYVVYNGREERTPAGDEFLSDPMLLSEPEGVGVIIGTAFNAYLYRAFQPQNKKGRGYGYISDFVASKDGRHYAYVGTKLNEFQMQIVVDGNAGSKFDKIVSPLFSPDGRFLLYRARHEGKRFLVVSDLKGKIVSRHKDYSMVFQPVFGNAGKSVAYGVLDGNELWWKVEKLEGK